MISPLEVAEKGLSGAADARGSEVLCHQSPFQNHDHEGVFSKPFSATYQASPSFSGPGHGSAGEPTPKLLV